MENSKEDPGLLHLFHTISQEFSRAPLCSLGARSEFQARHCIVTLSYPYIQYTHTCEGRRAAHKWPIQKGPRILFVQFSPQFPIHPSIHPSSLPAAVAGNLSRSSVWIDLRRSAHRCSALAIDCLGIDLHTIPTHLPAQMEKEQWSEKKIMYL